MPIFSVFLAKVMPKRKRPEKRDIKEELDKLKATMHAMVAARVEKTINDMIPALMNSIKASIDRDKHGPIPIYNVVTNNQNAPVIESPAANPSSGRDDDGGSSPSIVSSMPVCGPSALAELNALKVIKRHKAQHNASEYILAISDASVAIVHNRTCELAAKPAIK